MISVATAAVRDASMKNAAQEEKKKSEENGQFEGITVSGDSLWSKRGFSSLFGITSLVGWFIGKIVDVEVKSKYCKSCEYWKIKLGTTEYEEWYITYADECQANHEGSFVKMEEHAVVEMFVRSETLHGIFWSTRKRAFLSYTKENGHLIEKTGQKVKDLGGKDKLTAKLIDQLTIYHGNTSESELCEKYEKWNLNDLIS